MPTSLIEELQLDASNPKVSVTNLLRKTLMVAGKLDVSDVPDWVEKELEGYDVSDELPLCRIVHGAVKAKTVRGWVPVQFPRSDLDDTVSRQHCRESVAEIESLLKRDGQLIIVFPPEAQILLQQTFNHEAQFACFLDRSRYEAILDDIRNRVLRWALALDKAGVRGNGLSFTPVEKEKAHQMVFQTKSGDITIGVLGKSGDNTTAAIGTNARANNRSIDNSSVNQQDMGRLAEDFAQLRSALLRLATGPEHYAAIGAVASAEIAARQNNPTKVAEALSAAKSAGSWMLGVAKEIGAQVASAALKSYLGLPSA